MGPYTINNNVFAFSETNKISITTMSIMMTLKLRMILTRPMRAALKRVTLMRG